MNLPLLSLIVWTPMLAGLVLLFVPSTSEKLIRRIAVAGVSVSFALSWLAFFLFDRSAGGYQFVEKLPWFPSLGISYHVGADGISVIMLLLQACVSFTAVLVSYSIKQRVKEYFIFLMVLITSVYGVFVALDLFLFYFFYEMAVIPMYPLVGIWGSTNREYATMKLTLYITCGAVFALIGLLALYAVMGTGNFNLLDMEAMARVKPLDTQFQIWAFPFLLLGFGVITSLWPFHTWSPMGYAAAPSAVSMLHAGVLKKLGAYAILRIGINLMPQGAMFWMPTLAVLSLFNVLYAGLAAMTQKDMKFIIGYSSVSHMGMVLLGLACLNPMGMNGTVLFMFSHGVMTALIFALIGFFYDQTHTRMVPELGGLAKKLPFIGTCFCIGAMASVGLPGFSNFVSEIMIFLGAWDQYRWITVLAVFGLVVTATYMLRVIRSVFFGPMDARWNELRDARTVFQRAPYVLLIAVLIIFGFWPKPLLRVIEKGTAPILEQLAHE